MTKTQTSLCSYNSDRAPYQAYTLNGNPTHVGIVMPMLFCYLKKAISYSKFSYLLYVSVLSMYTFTE